MTRPRLEERQVRLRDGVELWTSSSWLSDEDDDGEARSALVLVHGGPGLWDYLEPVATCVAGVMTTHRYDQRGCGRSEPSDVQTMARTVADLEELREAFGHERWAVFGHSFGAAIATAYAAAHPDRVSAVVWCAGTGPDWPSQRAAARAVEVERLGPALVEEHRRLGELGQRGRTWEQEVRWRMLQWLPDQPAPATAALVASVEVFAATPLPVNERANRALAGEEFGREPAQVLEELAGIEVPVLVVRGSEDPRPASGTLAVVEALPNAELVVVEGAGHLPWDDQPADFSAVLRGFAERLIEPSGSPDHGSETGMSEQGGALSAAQLDRAAGVLLGQAVGDALGVPYEFVADDQLPHLGDATDGRAEMLGGGLGDYAPGEYSDDTQMSVIIAEVSSRGLDLTSAEALDQIADGFIAWAADGPADIGIQTAKVLNGTSAGPGSAERLRRACAALAAAGERTGGNGALMRTGIVGLTRLHDRETTARAARAVAELTHADPDAGDSCVLWSEAVRVAVLEGRFDVEGGLDLLPPDRRPLWSRRIGETARTGRDQNASNGWTVAALQDAWTAITWTPVPAQTATPSDHLSAALHGAVRTGNDTDTVAAIAGTLLGARWGASAVPAPWSDLVHGIGGRRAADLERLALETATRGALTAG